MRFAPHLLILAGLALSAPAEARQADDPIRFLLWPVEDVRAISGGLNLKSAGIATGAAAGIWLMSRHDESLTDWANDLESNRGLRLAQEFGHARVVRPTLGVLLVGRMMTGNTRSQDASFTALESVILANLVTNSLKSVFGRARPWENRGSGSFSPFSGHRSMPSGHATTAFASLTPFALYYGGIVGGGLFLLATTTAFSRMATNAHWFSDVVAGSLIGFSTGWVLTRRHVAAGRVTVRPGPASLAVTVSLNRPRP
ncbi:MAG: phosphatase PAP2 family protein [Rhodothermales bacterium]|nr:phosphatase PAP2 family protein [Rhodothermales bacterium]